MMFLRFLGIGALVLLMTNLVWRLASRHRSLPCPSWMGGSLETRLFEPLTRWTLDRMDLRPGQRVLEIGPGPGRLLIPAARRVLPGGDAVGLDIQPAMVKRLETRARMAGVSNLGVVHGDGARSNFPPESFDVIYLAIALGEIPDREGALRECYRALKPGGQLSVTEVFPDPHFQSAWTVRRLAEEAGFRLREIRGLWYFFTANFAKDANARAAAVRV